MNLTELLNIFKKELTTSKDDIISVEKFIKFVGKKEISRERFYLRCDQCFLGFRTVKGCLRHKLELHTKPEIDKWLDKQDEHKYKKRIKIK